MFCETLTLKQIEHVYEFADTLKYIPIRRIWLCFLFTETQNAINSPNLNIYNTQILYSSRQSIIDINYLYLRIALKEFRIVGKLFMNPFYNLVTLPCSCSLFDYGAICSFGKGKLQSDWVTELAPRTWLPPTHTQTTDTRPQCR